MPYIGEQPAQTGNILVYGRATTTKVEITAGEVTITTRSGTVVIGVA